MDPAGSLGSCVDAKMSAGVLNDITTKARELLVQERHKVILGLESVTKTSFYDWCYATGTEIDGMTTVLSMTSAGSISSSS